MALDIDPEDAEIEALMAAERRKSVRTEAAAPTPTQKAGPSPLAPGTSRVVQGRALVNRVRERQVEGQLTLELALGYLSPLVNPGPRQYEDPLRDAFRAHCRVQSISGQRPLGAWRGLWDAFLAKPVGR